MRPTEVSTAEPMAKPLPVAAVVLPMASRASVMSRTLLRQGLDHLGDAAGVVGDGAVGVGREGDAERREHAHGRDGDAVEAREGVAREMARTMMHGGAAVPIMPTPRPWMTTVAGPVLPRPW